MCYAAPGPLCADHAQENKRTVEKEYHASRRKLNKTLKAMWAIENVYSTKEEAHATQEYQELLAQKNNLEKSIDVLFDEMQELQLKCEATEEGIKDLEEKVRDYEQSDVPQSDHNYAYYLNRLAKAKETYYSQLRAYDVKNSTVDGEKPSIYGDDNGIKYLERRMLKYKNKHENELDSCERAYHLADYLDYKKTLAHAVKTHEYVHEGIVDPLIVSIHDNSLKRVKYTRKLKSIDDEISKLENSGGGFSKEMIQLRQNRVKFA